MASSTQPVFPSTSTSPRPSTSTPPQPPQSSTSSPLPPPSSLPQLQPQPLSDDNAWMNVPPGPSHWIPPSNDATPSNETIQGQSNPPNRPPRMVDTDGEESDEEDDGDQRSDSQDEGRSRCQMDTYLFHYDSSPPKIFKKQSAKSFKAKPINGTSDYEREVKKFSYAADIIFGPGKTGSLSAGYEGPYQRQSNISCY